MIELDIADTNNCRYYKLHYNNNREETINSYST